MDRCEECKTFPVLVVGLCASCFIKTQRWDDQPSPEDMTEADHIEAARGYRD